MQPNKSRVGPLNSPRTILDSFYVTACTELCLLTRIWHIYILDCPTVWFLLVASLVCGRIPAWLLRKNMEAAVLTPKSKSRGVGHTGPTQEPCARGGPAKGGQSSVPCPHGIGFVCCGIELHLLPTKQLVIDR